MIMNHSICMEFRKYEHAKFCHVYRTLQYFMNGWRLTALGVAMLAALPIVFIFSTIFHPETEIWRHLKDTILADVVVNTGILAAGVLVLTCVLGVSLAWLTGVCDFPGRRVFSWALLLPLAIPTYVLSFVFLGIFDFSGPVQTLLRSWGSARNVWFPNVRSAGGIITVMSVALYPYVYLLSRSAFKSQGKRALEASQSLGYNRWTTFYKVVIPMARPWIAGGMLLVFMETLADFGAVSIFNFDTFTTAIYKAWYGFFSLSAAGQLSSILVVIVFGVMFLEQKARAKMRFTHIGRSSTEAELIPLSGWKKWGASAYAGVVVLLAFGIPLIQLLIWSISIFHEEFNHRYLAYFFHSLLFAVSATLVITLLGITLSYTQRRHADKTTQFLVKFSTLGYALPGTVLAVGLVFVIVFADNMLAGLAKHTLGVETDAILQGTIFTVIAAYVIRFMAAGFNPISSAMNRIKSNLDEASISLNVTGVSLLRRVHFPMLRNGIMTAALLVFVDVMKEMPITLMTRPFGWDTLAVKIFELTSEGEWQRAALPAVALVISGLVPVIFLTRQTDFQLRHRRNKI